MLRPAIRTAISRQARTFSGAYAPFTPSKFLTSFFLDSRLPLSRAFPWRQRKGYVLSPCLGGLFEPHLPAPSLGSNLSYLSHLPLSEILYLGGSVSNLIATLFVFSSRQKRQALVLR